MASCLPPITTEFALLRLLQLCSPALPVGAYAFSQGLEGALDLGWTQRAEQVEHWLHWQVQQSLALVDLPLALHAHAACATHDWDTLRDLNDLLLACRETQELRLADTAMGEALLRLLPKIDLAPPFTLAPPSFLALFTFAAARWEIPAEQCALGYAWTWLENQVIAATKLLPLGQTQAQQLLGTLQQALPAALATARSLPLAQVGASLPGLAFASLHHETQYTRLFRS